MDEIEIKTIDESFLSNNLDSFKTISLDLLNDYWGDENYLRLLPKKFDLSLVAQLNKEIIGFIIASEKDSCGYIHRFIVKKEYRTKKIGYKLQCEFEKILKSFNINKIKLKVSCCNYKAVKFYHNNGYSIYKHSIDSMTNDTLYCMIKNID